MIDDMTVSLVLLAILPLLMGFLDRKKYGVSFWQGFRYGLGIDFLCVAVPTLAKLTAMWLYGVLR